MTSFAPAHKIKDRSHDSRHHGLFFGRGTPRLRAPQMRPRLDLLNPDPHAWTDDDLVAGLCVLSDGAAKLRLRRAASGRYHDA